MAGDKYILINRDDVELEADPTPTGWEDGDIVLERDMYGHGIFFDYGIDRLFFTGTSADFITEEYETYGVNGQMSLRILTQCSEDSAYDEIYFGQLNFTDYERNCGNTCVVSITLEAAKDIMAFRNNYEQKVNLLDTLALDRATPLDEYSGLNFDLIIPSRELKVRLEGTAQPGNFPIYPISLTTTGLFTTMSVRPSYTEGQIAELETADLIGASNYRVNPQNDPPMHPFVFSPILDLTTQPGCTNGLINYQIRLKGHVAETGSNNRSVHVQAVFNKGEYNDTTDPAIEKVSISPTQIYLGDQGPNLDFDVTFTGIVAVEPGEKLYVRIFDAVVFNAAGRTTNLYVTWDAETSVKLWTNSACAPNPAKVFMINEAMSRVAESITNGSLKLFSNTIGRTDSQPYATSVDSCAGMFAITHGLNVRRKLLVDGTAPGVFVTMQQLFDDLNSMWNIGYTIEPDPNRPGFNRLRIEDWEYFYQNAVGLVLREATEINKQVDKSRIYNQLQVGFNKWEAQKITGLDEFMTQRTYRLDITGMNQILERICSMILSTYCIEETRRLRDTTQDWTYDNDIFGFCLKRGEGVNNVRVEMMSESAQAIQNIMNPGSCYNHRVSPARNAMRWFNFIMQGVKQLDVTDLLYFSEGKGNYVARYLLTNCAIEGSVLAENADIGINNFALADDAKPITFAEIDTFSHPLSYNQFKRLKNDPTLMFKSVVYYCNNTGNEGWIKRIQYSRSTGMAEFQLIPKNPLQVPTPIPPCAAFVYNLQVVEYFPGQGVSIAWNDDFGNNWHWTLEYSANASLNQSGISDVPEVQFTDLAAGDWIFTVQGYCDGSPGQNIEQVTLIIEPTPFLIQLSAQKVFRENIQEWKWIIIAEPVNYSTFQQAGHFFVKICYFSGVTVCNTEDGNDQGEIEILIGASYTTTDTWGAATESATLLEVRIKDLTGLTEAQVIKKAGETWTLIFV